MKKILLTAALVMTMAFGASAQFDGFITSNGDGDSYSRDVTMPLLPTGGVGHDNGDQPATAPIGSGLIVLTALGMGYAVKRSRE